MEPKTVVFKERLIDITMMFLSLAPHANSKCERNPQSMFRNPPKPPELPRPSIREGVPPPLAVPPETRGAGAVAIPANSPS